MIKFRIGTEYLDQFDKKESFAISKAISKIGEINLRHGDRSTGFKVPLTAKNTRLLNYSTILSSSTNNQTFTKIFGQVVENDVVVGDGYFQVIKYNPYKKEVDLRFYGGNTDWFSDLKDRKINQNTQNYNLNEFEIEVNEAFILDNFTKDLDDTTPYKFFLIDNGGNSDRNQNNNTTIDTSFDDYQIGFSQGYIFNKIMDSVNIKTKGNMFNDPKFFNTLITSSLKTDPQFEALYTRTANMSSDYYYEADFTTPNTVNNVVFGDLYDPIWSGSKIVLDGSIDGIQTDFSLTVLGVPTATPELYLTVREGVNIIYTNTINGVIDRPDGIYNAYVVFKDEFFHAQTLPKGTEITYEFSTNMPPNDPNLKKLAIVGDANTSSQPFLRYQLFNYTKPYEVNQLIPNINQDKFVKDVLTQFGAITQYDVKTKTLICNKFSIIEDNKIKAKDWSNKVDLSSIPIIDVTKVVQKYGKRSFFKYKENKDTDLLATNYKNITNYTLGDGIININNSFLDDDKTIYNSPYSPTVTSATFPINPITQGGFTGSMFLPYIPHKKLTGEDDLGDPIFDENELNPRKLLYVKNVNISDSYKGDLTNITINGGSSFTEMPFVYFDKDDYPSFNSPLNKHLESLSFGELKDLTNNTYGYGQTQNKKDTIISSYYHFQKKILDKPIYLEIYLRLTPLDVQNIDFFTPIWLNFGLDSGHYYIDEISQYQGSNKSTKVKLVKI